MLWSKDLNKKLKIRHIVLAILAEKLQEKWKLKKFENGSAVFFAVFFLKILIHKGAKKLKINLRYSSKTKFCVLN